MQRVCYSLVVKWLISSSLFVPIDVVVHVPLHVPAVDMGPILTQGLRKLYPVTKWPINQ